MTDLEAFTQVYKEAGDVWELPETVKVIDEGDWVQDGKYQSSETIVEYNNKFYSIQQSRSGSYHSDWYYNSTYISPVERKEETTVVVSWVYTDKPIEVPEKY